MLKYVNQFFVLLFIFSFSSAHSATTTYTSQANYLTALGGTTVITQNFDGLTSGDIIADGDTLDNATYSYAISGGFEILVDDYYDTTSPNNYLGTTDGSGAFFGGDSFTITFDQTLHAIGLYVISADTIFDDDFTITTSSGQTASNSEVPDITLSDGGAFYIGLIEDDFNLGFNSITFSSSDENYLFNIDDITVSEVSAVPLPAAVWLFGSGLAFLTGMRRTKRNSNLTLNHI